MGLGAQVDFVSLSSKFWRVSIKTREIDISEIFDDKNVNDIIAINEMEIVCLITDVCVVTRVYEI